MAQYDLALAKLQRRKHDFGLTPRELHARKSLKGVIEEAGMQALIDLRGGWDDNQYALIGQQLAEKLVDMAAMFGFESAHRLLRTAINAMRVYPTIDVESTLCAKTLLAIRFIISKQSEIALLGAVRTAQVMYLAQIATMNPVAEDYLSDWLARANDC
ncbi:hypothetical protein [Nevskia sp.]|uniref:hypothetical protein n=1 Tax=Nevskia sp. TaxID=1929292 RepID=UPI0025DFEEE8|nr:hypothetical protein [Nevskia sp.]